MDHTIGHFRSDVRGAALVERDRVLLTAALKADRTFERVLRAAERGSAGERNQE